MAAIVVVPGVKVVLNLVTANVFPLLMVIVGSTFPTLICDDDRLIVVSCVALAGLELESWSSTNTHS